MAKDTPVNKNMAYIIGVIFSAGVLVGNASLTTVRSVRNANDISVLKQSKAADDVRLESLDMRMESLVDDVKFIRTYIINWEPDDGQTAKEEEEKVEKET